MKIFNVHYKDDHDEFMVSFSSAKKANQWRKLNVNKCCKLRGFDSDFIKSASMDEKEDQLSQDGIYFQEFTTELES